MLFCWLYLFLRDDKKAIILEIHGAGKGIFGANIAV
jgi:hypothetical protein